MKRTSDGIEQAQQRWPRWTRLLGAVSALVLGMSAARADVTMTTLAGTGTPSSTDNSNPLAATFASPQGLALDGANNVYVLDNAPNSKVRKITSGGVVSTLVSTGLASAGGIAVDAAGNLYVADTFNHAIKRYDASGTLNLTIGLSGTSGVSVAGPVSNANARFNIPYGITVNSGGTIIYVADTGNQVIRKIDLSQSGNEVTTIAGTQGSSGTTNGTVGTQFNTPSGLVLVGTNLFVADRANNAIRRIDLTTSPNTVSTFAGTAGGAPGSLPGTGASASFSGPMGIVADSGSNLWVTDASSHILRKVTSGAVVTNEAGSAGLSGFADGTGTTARFSSPWGVGVDSSGNVYVADSLNHRIRKSTTGPVNQAPSISSHPSNTTFTIGVSSSVNFSVVASGTPTPSYQWARAAAANPFSFTDLSNGTANGLTVTGAQSSTLVISSALSTNSGDIFRVTVNNGVGSPAVSNQATLTVSGGSTSPTITQHPSNVAAVSGQTVANFIVSATATPAITSYQWQRLPVNTFTWVDLPNATVGGVTFSGTQSTFLTVQNLLPTMNGDQFRCVVNNGTTPATSNAATLTVPPIVNSPSTVSFAPNQFSTFTFTGSGTPTPTINVTLNSVLPSGISVSGNTLSGQTNDQGLGTYTMSVTATNSGGTSSPQFFTLNVQQAQAPVITSSSSVQFNVGQPGSFTFTAFGAPVPQFFLSGAGLPPGMSFSSPTISGTPIGTDGSPFTFQVTAQNSAGISSPQTFTITVVGVAPSITLNPVNTTVNVGANATFTSAAIGTPTPTLRWQRQAAGTFGFVDVADSVTYSGTQTGTLTITNVDSFMGGDQYRLSATNTGGGTVYSSPATLTVNIGTAFTTLAGLAGFSGGIDGVGTAARLNAPSGMTMDPAGNMYVADSANHVIRKITTGGVVTTVAGQAGFSGNVDGIGNAARFNSPQAVAVDSIGNLYVADTFNHTIRFVSLSGSVTTLAGTAGSPGSQDGVGAAARFFLPSGIVVDSTGTAYVADAGNHAIRMLQVGGNVSTFAGALGQPGTTDSVVGQIARFNQPTGMVRDSVGNMYVTDSQNHTIRKITTTASVSTVAGFGGAPGTNDGNGTNARFNRPQAIAVDAVGVLYVADTFSNTLRKIATNGDVTTLAGLPGVAGSTDGVGGQARFNQPFGITVDSAGNVYVADTRNHTIRRSGLSSAPTITTQPSNRTAGPGGSATFTVVATGAPNPGFLWQRAPANNPGTFVTLINDATYSGVNTASLTVSNATQEMNGDQFRVIVNNGVQPTAQSSTAVLSIGTPPAFTSPNVATFQALKDGTVFTVTVTSSNPTTFSATGLPSWATLNSTSGQITGTPPNQDGSPFNVTITANNGVTATQTLTITVTPPVLPPTIAVQPANTTIDQSLTATFSVTVGGTAPFTYQWRKNGAPISGGTAATFQIGSVQNADEGTYSVVVANAVGTVTSNGATLSINSTPLITSQPRAQNALVGGTAAFSVTAVGGTTGFSYQWRRNGVAVPGGIGATLTFPNVTAADAGNYDVVVSNPFGSVTSSMAQLNIVTAASAPIITSQPSGRSVVTGGSASLSVAATGAPSPTFQWRKNGSPISGATNTTLAFTNAQAGDAANYDVIISNIVGNVTSAPAGLTVLTRSYAGFYFGSFGSSLGDFALFVRGDNTGVFLSYLPASTAPIMSLNVSINGSGAFTLSQGAVLSAASTNGEPPRAASLAPVILNGTIGTDGSLTGNVQGGVSATLTGTRSPDVAGSQTAAGFYQAGVATNGGALYTIAGPNGVAFAVVQSGNVYDGGRGQVSGAGTVTVVTSRNIINESINGAAGTVTGTSAGTINASFAGGSDAALARQRLVNISSRARVATGDSVAIAGFVISGEDSKPVLIRAVGPTLTGAPFNVAGALASPRLELFRGTTSLAVNTGIGTGAGRTSIDAAGSQAGAFALGAAGTDAAILTTLAPGNYTAVVSSSTNTAGVALVEVYDLSAPIPGQKLLNIATRAAAGTAENTLIAGFVVPPGSSKRVLIRGVGPGLSAFGVTGVLAQPILTLLNSTGGTVTANTNWATSTDAALITSASTQVGAFGLATNDSAMIVTLAPGNYTAQVTGVNAGTGVALIEVYEVP